MKPDLYNRYSITVWFKDARAESDAEITRKIYKRFAKSPKELMNEILDELITCKNVDNEVWFGPATTLQKGVHESYL